MKLGLGLYRQSLTADNFRFARQCGATHIVAHLVDYFGGKNPTLTRGDDARGWGVTRAQGKIWTAEELTALRREIERHGLVLEAVENFDPAHWHDVLLDGPRKAAQLEDLKQLILNFGKAGIPIIGYNFSIAGVWGWTKQPVGRGEAPSLVFDEADVDLTMPMPSGMVWNMTHDEDAPAGFVAPVSDEELWERLEAFLKAVLPVAEECGVRLAAHPDDPPVEVLRGHARLVNHPDKFHRLLDLVPSPASAIEYCMGTVQEMPAGDLYASLDSLSKAGRIGYVHARNVVGKVPRYREVFLDEGDIDMRRALRILAANNFDGVIIPDHTPEVTCPAPWHAGMAHALGYLKALIGETR